MASNRLHKTVDDIASLLLRRGIASSTTIVGCTNDEIAVVTKDVGQVLPVVYQQFLATMGKGAGRFFEGSDFFFPDTLRLGVVARQILTEENTGLTLPEDAVVFSMHQGYEFLFIRASEGDDPPVYYFIEDSLEFTKKADCLSDFLWEAATHDW